MSYEEHFDLDITEDIRRYTAELLKNKEYLFVRNEYERDPLTREKVKVQYGYCSHCGKEHKTGYTLKHNEVVVCEECGAEIKVKDIRYGKKCLYNDLCFYWFDKSKIDKNIVVCRGYYLIKHYDEDYKNPKCDYLLDAVYIFDANTRRSRMFKWDWWSNELIERASIFDFEINSLSNVDTFICEESLKRAVRDTSFQYCDFERKKICASIVKYLDRFNKYPWLEQLEKMGFIELAETIIDGETTFNSINFKGKDIFKKLKLNRGEVKALSKMNMKAGLTAYQLRIYQLNRDNGFKPSFEEAEELYKGIKYSGFGCSVSRVNAFIKKMGTKKLLNYLNKQYKEFNNNSYYGMGSVMNKWEDYLKNCKKLNWEIKNKSILFPKDLAKAHNHTTKLIEVEKNREHDKKIKRRLPGLKKKYFFKDNTFFIRPAESSEDLINEGGKLNHCVAVHYMKPYAEAITDILMVRRIDNPTEPLVTVEVRNGIVTQAYGKNDTIPKKDVQAFLKKFKNEILSKVNKNKKGKVA